MRCLASRRMTRPRCPALTTSRACCDVASISPLFNRGVELTTDGVAAEAPIIRGATAEGTHAPDLTQVGQETYVNGLRCER